MKKAGSKKGSRPHNWVPVGSETITTDGYLAVKMEEPNVWEFKHKLVWRKAHGEIPENMKIIFLDRNRLNVTPQNLALVSNDEMLEMNRKRMICEDAELTKTGVQIARLNRIVSKRRKNSNEPKK
ncbi:MAG: HNH endonuclease signature motif containing protein [Oscillibacter sp.]